MQSRRNFLTGIATGSAATMLAAPRLALATQTALPITVSSTTAANAVHTSYAHILVKHLRKMSKNPKHNPFTSGELLTAYRMHCDALQTSGINAAVTASLRSAASAPTLTAKDISRYFQLMSKLGVDVPDDVKQHVTQQIVTNSAQTSPLIAASMSSHTILKTQRSVHGTMMKIKKAHDRQLRQTGYQHHPVSHYMNAGYHPSSAHLVLAGFDAGDGYDADGWSDDDDDPYDGDGDGSTNSGDYSDDSGDAYSESYTTSLNFDGTITMPSGAEVQGCTVWYALGALVAGISSGLLALAAADAVVVIIAGVAVTGGALAVLLALLAALAAYYSVVC